MDFQTAIQQVVAITKRGDKVPVIKWAINSAIAELIRMDKFSFDLYQHDYAIPSADASSAVHFVAYTEFPGGTPRHIESIITDNDLSPFVGILPTNATRGGRNRVGIYYKRNDGLYVKMRQKATTIRISYYKSAPTLVADTDTHWSLEQAFNEIVTMAAFHTFSMIGEDKDASRYQQTALVAYDRVAKELV